MEKAASRLTGKYQATIPPSIRKALGLKSGDAVVFEVKEPGVAMLRRQTPLGAEYLRAVSATLESEWLSEEDEAAYRDL